MALPNRKLGGKPGINKNSAVKKSGGIRDKFKKKSSSILEKTYNEREERTKAGGNGKSIFNEGLMQEFGVEVFSPHDGDNYIEALPLSFDDATPYHYPIPVHYGVGINKDSYICTKRHGGKPCYRCEQQQKLFKQNSVVTDEIKALYPTDREGYLLWDRTKELAAGEEPEYKLKLWASPKSKYHAVVQSLVKSKRDKKIVDISDISEGGEGKTVTFELKVPEKKGKDSFPTYVGIQLIERDIDIPDEILEILDCVIEAAKEKGKNAFDFFLNTPDYNEVKESMLSEGSQEEEEQEEEKSSRSPKGNREKAKPPFKDVEKIQEELEVLKEDLEAMSGIKFKMWCKKNNYEDALEMDKEEAIEGIIDDMFQKANDDIPY